MEIITVALFVTVMGMAMSHKNGRHMADFMTQDR